MQPGPRRSPGSGGFGKPPAPDKVAALDPGATPAITIPDSGMAQGYSNSLVYLLAYRAGWEFLGAVPTAEDNEGASACVDDRRCWSWEGKIKVLSTHTHGLPDLVVERQGTQQEEPGDDKIVRSPTVTYEFNRTTYEEKGKPPPQVPSAAAAKQENTPPLSPGRQWFAPDVNFTSCIRSRSPADRIQMIQDNGKHPRITDLPGGAVEITEQASNLHEQVWTYYPSQDACTATLPQSQRIPSRYR